jgi:hypothetical protein
MDKEGCNVFRLNTASGSVYDFRVESTRHATVYLTATRVVNKTKLPYLAWGAGYDKILQWRNVRTNLDEVVAFTARSGLKALGLTYSDIFNFVCGKPDTDCNDGTHVIDPKLKDVIMGHADEMDEIFFLQTLKHAPRY